MINKFAWFLSWKFHWLVIRPIRRASILTCLLSSLLFYAPAVMVSPRTVNHPLWILAFCFSALCVIRVITHNSYSVKNPSLGSRFVFSVIQGIAATLIAFSVITGGFHPLWLGLSFIFGYLCRENFSGIAHILRVRESERNKLKRANATRESLRRLEEREREEKRKNQ
jgi:hypothetical protein